MQSKSYAGRYWLENGFGYNDSIYHGDFGNLEFLSEASRTRGCSSLRQHVQGIASQLIDIGQREGWRSGLAIDQPTLGLMTGLAGTGYALLRLYDPQAVPSVLTADPPSETMRPLRLKIPESPAPRT